VARTKDWRRTGEPRCARTGFLEKLTLRPTTCVRPMSRAARAGVSDEGIEDAINACVL